MREEVTFVAEVEMRDLGEAGCVEEKDVYSPTVLRKSPQGYHSLPDNRSREEGCTCTSVVERQPPMHKALGSIPSMA